MSGQGCVGGGLQKVRLHPAHQSYLRAKPVRRRWLQGEEGRRLVSVTEHLPEVNINFWKTGHRLDGVRNVTEGTVLLQLEQSRQGGFGIGCLGSRYQLGNLAVPVPVSSVSSHSPLPEQDTGAAGGKCAGNTAILARQALVQCLPGVSCDRQEASSLQELGDGHDNWGVSSQHCVMPADRLHSFWQQEKGGEQCQLSSGARELIEASWRPSTEAQYSSSWRKWLAWTSLHGVRPTAPFVNDVLNYLSNLYQDGLSYRTVNTARSTLSTTLPPIDGFAVGKHPLVTRLMKGIFNKNPPQPSLFPAWSVKTTLNELSSWSPAKDLSLMKLTEKTLMLLALSTGKRASSLHLLSLEDGYCQISESKVVLQPLGLEKHSRPDKSFPPIVLKSFNENPTLCPVFYIKTYLKRTKNLRKSKSLFVTVNKPHKAASVATLLRWMRSVIYKSGQRGTGGSFRSVATSTAVAKGMTMSKVLKAGDWSRATTFRNFYYKPVPINDLQNVVINMP